MARELAGSPSEKKLNAPKILSNGVSHDTSDFSKASEDYVESDRNAMDSIAEEVTDKQDVLGPKSTNHLAALKPEVLKSSKKKFSRPIKPNDQIKNSATQRQISTVPPPAKPKTFDASGSSPSNSNDLQSSSSARKSQPSSPQTRKPHKYQDEEDNWSVGSSTASIRTSKFRPTVGIAPVFKSVDRASRRKEFYTKLEEKQQALEAEKRDYTERTKEEEQAVIKQLRKSMTYKANPVPDFYQEGPPPKAELKKLPLTRPKSPNLTRRKSCGDVVPCSPSADKAVCARAVRHSIGSHIHGSPVSSPLKKKDQLNTRSGTDGSKVKKVTTQKTTARKIVETAPDIAVSG